MRRHNESAAAACGISGPSIANGSINRGRLGTATASTSGSVLAGGIVDWSYGTDYSMQLSALSVSSFTYPLQPLIPENANHIAFKNTGGVTYNYSISARQVSP